MLRVGLTGDLGSGKSTVARMFAERGAVVLSSDEMGRRLMQSGQPVYAAIVEHFGGAVARMFAERGGVVLSSDEMGRKLMQPGQPVYAAIVEHFGGTVVAEDGAFDRRVLARLAFTEGRVEELNAIVHPVVIAEQARLIKGLARKHPDAIVIVESALLFTTKYGNSSQPWRDRFDRMVLVTAPEEQKIARFVERAAAGRLLDPQERAALEADARARLAMQTANEAHAAECLVIQNNGDLVTLLQRVGVVWRELCQVARFEP